MAQYPGALPTLLITEDEADDATSLRDGTGTARKLSTALGEFHDEVNALAQTLGITGSFNFQAAALDLDDLELQWQRAGALAAHLHFHEATGNGTNRVNLTGPQALGADVTVELPSVAGTLLTNAAVGSSVQAWDADLDAIAALATTAYGRSFLTLADAAAARALTGSVIGTDVQAFDADLAAISALATTAYGRGFLPLTDAAAALAYIGTYSTTVIDSLIANAAAGVAKRATVRISSTGNLGLSGLAAIDGVTPVAGDLILAKDQTAPAQNGIYVAAAGAWARSAQFDTYDEHPGSLIAVQEGSTNADSVWLCMSNAGGTLGTTAITFQRLVTSGELLAVNNLSDLTNVVTARSNLGLAIGSQVQAWDADLDALAALATTGIVARTGAATYTPRSITGTSPVSVTNGDGIAGNPTVAVSAALADLSSRWTPASSASGAGLLFHEDTDNGSNFVALGAPAALASDRIVSLPDLSGTVQLLQRDTMDGTADKTWTTGATVLALTGTMAAIRTVTMPPANAYPAGTQITFVDERGGITEQPGTVSQIATSVVFVRAGSDTIEGAFVFILGARYGTVTFASDGSSRWTLVDYETVLNATRGQVDDLQLATQAFDEFWGGGSAIADVGALNWSLDTTGAGAGLGPVASGLTGSSSGTQRLTTGTTAAGRAFLYLNSPLIGTAATILEWRAGLSNLIASGTEEYTVRVGTMAPTTMAAPTTGLWFEYTSADTTWHAKTRDNSGSTSDTDTNIAVTTAGQRLRIVADGAGNALFSVGMNAPIQIAANLPTGFNGHTIGAGIIKTVGTTARTLDLDYMFFRQASSR